MPPSPVTIPGFFGKLPACGDFVSRQLPRSFLDPWDQWLQTAIFHSRQQLGEDWLACYLRSPLWCFLLSAGLCGQPAYAGVLMPSIDRVGRYYPLVIAAPLPARCNPLALLTAPWFEAAAQIALAGLDEQIDLETFATQVEALGLPDTRPARYPDAPAWHCPLDSGDPAALAGFICDLAGGLLERCASPYSIWWGSGSPPRITPCLLLCQGLPAPDRFAALLAGGWKRWGWQEGSEPGAT
ncbi:MAG: type VI secretion system-associated protein TagF [Candidatus Competibacteraceae bacterium]